MTLKIKRGQHGYYTVCEDGTLPMPADKYPLEVAFNQEGMQCPLGEGSVELKVLDINGVEHTFVREATTKKLATIYKTDDVLKTAVDEVDLDDLNGVWYFLSGIPVKETTFEITGHTFTLPH